MRRSPSRLLLSVVVSASLLACGGDDTTASPTPGDELATAGAPAGMAGAPAGMAGAPAGMAGAPAGMAGTPSTDDGPSELNGCKASAYEDASADEKERIVLLGSDGLVFTPPCITIAVGQSVTFKGSLAAHPLAPGNASDASAGSRDNPITQTRSGSSVEFTFESPGTYPYFCELHGFGAGKGMAGAVFVDATK